jgi:hypothetical protein
MLSFIRATGVTRRLAALAGGRKIAKVAMAAWKARRRPGARRADIDPRCSASFNENVLQRPANETDQEQDSGGQDVLRAQTPRSLPRLVLMARGLSTGLQPTLRAPHLE